jgi:nucleotide-binding universal stress UspA family protein
MLSANTILCPVHPGADAHPALMQALSLAETCRATVHVVPHPEATAEPDAGRVRSLHNQILDIVAAATSGSPLPPRSITTALDQDGVTVDRILQYVEQEDIDLVVLDTPSDRGPIPALASEPTRQFVTHLNVPVFVTGRSVMRCGTVGEDHSTPIRRILVPTDFSENSMSALRHAFAMAVDLDAEIDLLHVMDRPQYVALNDTDMLSLSDATLPERKAKRRAKALIPDGPLYPTVHVHIRHGDAADQIGQFATKQDSDLLVMSTHGTISREQHPLGHVVERVLRRVARPVFLTRAFGRSLVGETWTPRAGTNDGAPGSAPDVSARTTGWKTNTESSTTDAV